MAIDEQQLLRDLDELGLCDTSFRAIALLPLVEVAWADNKIQLAERNTILEIARGHGMLQGRASSVLEAWLREKPDKEYFDLGKSVLVRLAQKPEGIGADLPEHYLETVVEFCSLVAESAGSLFGLTSPVSKSEKRTIERIVEYIADASERQAAVKGIAGSTLPPDWMDMLDDLDEEL